MLRSHRAVALLIAAVWLVRALVPAGYMPSEAGQGHLVTLTLCSGAGGLVQKSMPDGTPDAHKTLCDFAPLSWSMAGAEAPPALAAPAAYAVEYPFTHSAVYNARSPHTTRARAPPAIV